MTLGQLITTLITLVTVAGAFLWIGLKLETFGKRRTEDIEDAAKEDVERIFNDEFREELRNRGRLHFEKIIGENAMFLQQDLRLTTSQLNEYMKAEIKKELEEEFHHYEESISSAKELAVSAIQKTQEVIEEQRNLLEKQMNQQAFEEKQRIIAKFEKDMADIVNHYLLAAVGNQIDLTVQLEYIFQYLEQNKQAIIEDIRSGT
ncbi:hypothetical protein KC930_03735 [Candidatus Saccharibacteria bacterium]|nr:hypothetical protein [Candidatus Saccharibacteria bacterium]